MDASFQSIICSWNAADPMQKYAWRLPTQAPTKITPNIKTAEWICEENHRIVRGRPASPSPLPERSSEDATAVNGIDRGVAVIPPSRSHLSNHQARSRSTTSAGKTRFPSSVRPFAPSHMARESCSVRSTLTCLTLYQMQNKGQRT